PDAPAPPALLPPSLHAALPIFARARTLQSPGGDRVHREHVVAVDPDAGEAEARGPPVERDPRLALDRLRDGPLVVLAEEDDRGVDRKSTRLNSSHVSISYAVFC